VSGVRPASEQEEPRAGAWLWRLTGRILGFYVRLVSRTARIEGSVTQDQVVFAFWHEANLAVGAVLFHLLANHRVVAFTTRGRRGMVVNALLESLGGVVVALPDEATRGSAASLVREVIAAAQDGLPVAVSSDGPLGPMHVAKPGAVIVAREAGLSIVPLAIAVRPAWRLNRRWDRQLVPLPFGRMQVVTGEAWSIGPHDRLRPTFERLQADLERVAAEADRLMAVR
jgi:hypothetical protein